MKKKITIIICAAVALILCASLVVENVFSMKITAEDSKQVYLQSSTDDNNWENVESGNVLLENEKFSFQLNCETTHFTVTHKQSGKVYHSIPQTTNDFVPNEEQMSEVLITYYDSKSTETFMNSYENSVEGKSFDIKTDGSAIRVYYSIQKSKNKIFVPEVLSQQTFEKDILTKLEAGPARRMKRYYTLYESESSDSDANEMKNKYAALEDENLYILGDGAGEHNYSEITGYMETAGYSQSIYAKELERLGIDTSASENQPAAFVIPVEYTLDNRGFTATILTDKITSDSENYQLTNVSVLPYFASCGYSREGWFIVPDGSGAVIDLNEKGGSTYSQSLWGNDQAVGLSVKSNVIQNAGMPVYGFHNGEDAFFTIVSGGAGVASVNAEVYGNEFQQSRIYTDFNIRAFDTSDMGELRRQALFNLYASDYVSEFPQVTYVLFPEKDTTYSDMANRYRDYLIENGILEERLEESKSVPVYIDFTGYETTEESFLGIATKAKTELSTIEGINNAVDELEKRGIAQMHVRLKAYANGGIYGTVSNKFDIDSCVGDKKDLETLAQKLQDKSGKLYLENNISTVYTTGNSFKKMSHAVRSLKKTVVDGIDFDLVARTTVEAANKYYLTSPAYFESLTENFIQTLSKESKDTSNYGYSWSDFGSKLWSDFNEQHPYDRMQSADAAVRAVSKATEAFGRIVTDGSNSYVLGNVDSILNLPLSDSALSCESYSVPFYQMVVHGYIDYSGAPINVSADSKKTYLASVECGANLYYSFYTSDEDPLKETQAGTLTYPTQISASYDTIETQYNEFNELFQGLRSQTIIDHARVFENVFVTTYEDGTEIAVNYSNKEVEIDGKTVPENGFTVIERGRE